MVKTNPNLKKKLLSLFIKLMISKPYIMFPLLQILYVVVPKRIMRKYLPF
jgi:hypothetical protein